MAELDGTPMTPPELWHVLNRFALARSHLNYHWQEQRRLHLHLRVSMAQVPRVSLNALLAQHLGSSARHLMRLDEGCVQRGSEGLHQVRG